MSASAIHSNPQPREGGYSRVEVEVDAGDHEFAPAYWAVGYTGGHWNNVPVQDAFGPYPTAGEAEARAEELRALRRED
jgi:hypothetical protein